ncbi:hypothetical protein LX32DRAFT_698834 [Colletotrichum zoysiae]|uniref:Uncharacterized protein n=1 Tax=Colletotrichum zoysiae TaxID=1216348 RepID=A0AAD9H504_9PEZI|nr:hypothetical protein LX32DRAFT_698834 [Colletotrichum zoysiae]
MASNQDTSRRGRPSGLQLRERGDLATDHPGPSLTTKRPLNEDGQTSSQAKRPRSVPSSVSSAGFGPFPSSLNSTLPDGVTPLDRHLFSFRRPQDHTSASVYGFVSEAPSRALGSNINQDPLLYARLTIRNGKDGAASEYNDMMQTLLSHASITISERLAAEYSWYTFQGILFSENLEFNKDTDTIHVALYHDEQAQWEGDVNNGGEFRIAMHQLLRSARGVVERSHAEGDNLKVKPAVEGAASQTIGDTSADDDEETIAPEPQQAPAGEIEMVIISSDSDSEDAQDDDEPSEVMASTGDREAPKNGQDIEDVMEMKDYADGWRQTCAYFAQDEDECTIDVSHGKKLPGAYRYIRLHQMRDIHKFYQSVTSGTRDLGATLAHQMGVGNTMTYQTILAVRRLAIISADHYKKYPQQHDSLGRCGLADRPFGIQYACEKSGLTAKIVEGCLLREAKAYFSPVLKLKGLGAEGEDWTVDFITCCDYAKEPANKPKTRRATDLGLIQQDKQLRKLELAIHLPGLMVAWRDASKKGATIPTRANDLSKVIRKGHGESPHKTYLHKDIVPRAIWNNLDHILSHSSRLAKLHEICTTARTDRDAYPEDAECWDGFRGPKNVLIFAK